MAMAVSTNIKRRVQLDPPASTSCCLTCRECIVLLVGVLFTLGSVRMYENYTVSSTASHNIDNIIIQTVSSSTNNTSSTTSTITTTNTTTKVHDTFSNNTISEDHNNVDTIKVIQLNNRSDDDEQYTSNEDELSNGFPADDSSNNITTCKWSPGKNDECIHLISKQMKPSVRRWLFFGDSTVFNLFNSSSLSKVLIHSPLEKVRNQQCYRSQLECNWMRGERCHLNDLFGFPYPEHWIPPNSSDLSLNFTGPQKFGALNPYCCDCSGCFSDFLRCDLIKNVSYAVHVESSCHGDRNDFIYGGCK